ncbi:GntR family transcriptional regulator [Amorphus sp. 3PC139-8]|uniref:GntR family transcriptional regulator n=1 Tax=Amorphus sp. 3PC139-8 TaxID=2735676 RepID=UPI00345D71C9
MYLQVAEQFRLRIERGVWLPGQQLPVLKDLQAELGLARVTIRQAFEVLEQRGLVHRHRGRGTFVADRIESRPEHVLPGNWSELVASLRPIEAKLLEGPQRATSISPAPSFDLEPDFSAWHLQRLHLIDKHPYCLIDIYIDDEIYAKDSSAFTQKPVITVLDQKYRHLIGAVNQVVTFSISDERLAEALGIELGQPVVKIERIVKTRSGSTILYTSSQYSGVDVRINMDISPPPEPSWSS